MTITTVYTNDLTDPVLDMIKARWTTVHRSGEFGAGVPVVAVEKLAPFNPNAG